MSKHQCCYPFDFVCLTASRRRRRFRNQKAVAFGLPLNELGAAILELVAEKDQQRGDFAHVVVATAVGGRAPRGTALADRAIGLNLTDGSTALS